MLAPSLHLLCCSSAPHVEQGDAGDAVLRGDDPDGDQNAGYSCLPWEPCAQGDKDCCWCPHTRLSTSTYADYPDIEVDSTGAYHVVWNQSTIQAVANHRYEEYEVYYLVEDGQPIQISRGPARMEYWSKLGLDSDDRPHAIWESRQLPQMVFSYSCIEYTMYTGQSWYIARSLSDGIESVGPPGISYDASGNTMAAVFSGQNVDFPYDPQLYIVLVTSDSSSERLVPVDGTTWAFYPAVVIDNSSDIHVVYSDGDVYHLAFNGGSWSKRTRITLDATSDQYQVSALSLDANNKLHLAYTSGHYPGYAAMVFYSTFDGNSWLDPICVTPQTTIASWASMAVDTFHQPHFVWQEYGADACSDSLSIWYRHMDGQSWTTPRIISRCEEPQTVFDTWQSNWGPDIAIGPDDKLHVAWEHARINLNYIEYTSCRLEDL